MFTFINVYVLSFLFAVLVPILIHLFNKKRKKRIKFSSIRFLKLLEKQRLRRLKLYEYLLIIIRSLIILALIIAFARPTLISRSFFSDNGARTTSVIIIDSGINMRSYDASGNRFERSNNRLKKLLTCFKTDDQVFVIQSSKPKDILTIPTLFTQTSASFSPGHWESSLKEAKKIFDKNPNFNRELFIISDFQFKNENFLEFIKTFEDIRVFFLKIGSSSIPNVGIDTVEIKNQLFELNKPIKIDVLLKSTGPLKTEPVEIHLFIDNQRVSHNRASFETNEKEVIPISFQPKQSGINSGYVEISDDDLLADNRYYFAFNIPSEIKTLFVNDNPSIYLKAAISSLSEESNIQVINEKYSSWARQNFQQYDIIFLSDFSRLSIPIISRLKEYLNTGRSLFLMPGPKTVPAEFNRDAISLGIFSKILQVFQTSTTSDFFQLNEPDLNHPLFTGLFRHNSPELSNPKFLRYFKFRLYPNDQVFLSYQNNDPFLFKTGSGEGRVYIFSSYIDDNWTDIQYRGLFLPLLSRLIQLASSNNTAVQSSVYVESEKLILSNLVTDAAEFFLIQPNGEKNRVIPTPVNQQYQFRLAQLSSPGIYQLFSDKTIISTIPVNVNTKSLNEPFVEISQLNNFDNIRTFSEEEPIEKSILEARFGSELWKAFIMFALILLLIELFFIKKMEGKREENQ